MDMRKKGVIIFVLILAVLIVIICCKRSISTSTADFTIIFSNDTYGEAEPCG
ncbi:MAG: hypothetical protein JW765_09655 [Deltaproteobacteria bacterium]|nr:hypothetical protein [Candidatus Zymogenaceae bacterium]